MKKWLVGLLFFGFAEIATLIIVGKAIGVFYTLLLIIMTSFIGVLIVKKRGTKSFQAVQKSIAQGQPPGVAMVETFLTFIGGVLLIMPGFITDILGLFFVFGVTRNLFKPIIFYWLRKKMKQGQVVILQK